MSKNEQILLIDPPYELKFKGPSTKTLHRFMILKNPSHKKVAFEIKTTEPNAFCVSQNGGTLAAHDKAKILVIFQPSGYDANECNIPKLLVKSVVIDPVFDYGEDGKTFQWRDIQKSRIMYSQLKCSFEMPSPEQLFESENIHEATTNVLEVNCKTYLQKATTEVDELREEIRQKEILLKALILELFDLKYKFIKQSQKLSQKRSVVDNHHLDSQKKKARIIME